MLLYLSELENELNTNLFKNEFSWRNKEFHDQFFFPAEPLQIISQVTFTCRLGLINLPHTDNIRYRLTIIFVEQLILIPTLIVEKQYLKVSWL